MKIDGSTFEITNLNGFVQKLIGSLSKSSHRTVRAYLCDGEAGGDTLLYSGRHGRQ